MLGAEGKVDFLVSLAGMVISGKETLMRQNRLSLSVAGLGDDVVNKTIPIILCAEENVVGNHGATIGDLDADTLFYFESRGIDRQEAQNIMLRANIEHVASLVNDEEFGEIVKARLEEVL